MKKQTDSEFSHGIFGKMVKGVHSLLLQKDQLSDTQNMQPGYGWKQRKGMTALTASAVASGLRWKSMIQYRDLKGDTDVILAHTYDSSGGEDLYQGSALPPNAITWSKKYDLTASCEKCQFANVAGAVLIANDKDFLIWRGTKHFPTAVWKYTNSNTAYTLFNDELFDIDTATSMPLNSLGVSDEVVVLSEMPLDKVTITGGNFNSTASKMLGFIWNGAWTALTDTDGTQSDGSYLIDDMSDLTNWDDDDNGNGVSSQDTFEGRQVLKLLGNGGAAAAGDRAVRSQDVGSFGDTLVFTMRVNCTELGAVADDDYFSVSLRHDDVRVDFAIDSAGIHVHDGASWNQVGTVTAAQDTWIEWTLVADIATAASATVDIYKDGASVATGVDCSYTGAFTDGDVILYQFGVTTNSTLSYVDIVRCGAATETGDSFSDGTETSDACFGQSGDITWTARTDEEKTDIEGVPGYAYKFMPAVALDASVSVTGLSVHSPMASVSNLWDGMYTPPTGCYVNDGTDNTDYVVYVNNMVENQYMDLSGVTTTDKIYVGFNERVNKIIYHMAADGKNTNAVNLTAVKYHNASGAATSVGTVTDTTKTSTKIFSQKGYHSWVDPGWQNEKMTIIGGDSTPRYWYEITVSAALADPTYVYHIQGVPIPKDPDPSRGVFAYKRRAWQIAPRNKENMVRYSGQDLPNVWNGMDSGYVAFGERPLLAAGAFYNETILYADTEMWMLQGNKPSNFGKLRLSSQIGIVSPESLVSIESGVVVNDSLKVVLAWFYFDGIWMFDGVRVWKISAPDIDSFFDPDHEDYIPHAYLDQTTGVYDFRTQCVMWNVVSGSGATTPTKTIVMHFPSLNFGIYDYGTDVDAMLSVINNKHYLIGGGHADGRVYLLDSGTTDLVNNVATAVDAYIITRDEFLSYSDGLRQQLESIWTEAQEAGGQLELDEYPDGSDTPQNIAKANLTVKGKIFGAIQKKLRIFSGQKTTKFRIRNRSKNARMNILGYSTTVDRGRSHE